MNTMTPDQLPRPYVASAHPGGARRSPGSAIAIALGVVALAAVGWLSLRAKDRDADAAGNGPTTTVTRTTSDLANGSAGNGAVTRDELSAAYTAVYGTTASAATLDCIAAEITSTGAVQAERLVRGEVVDTRQAQEGFTPFATCAPNSDFLGLMVPVTVNAFGGGADASCVSAIFSGFGVEGRAEALALALTDVEQFASRLQTTFAECTF